MARWFYQRPLDCCDLTELVVAKRLAHLGNEWLIRWGFYYETDREGEFLILGPSGRELVLEVKVVNFASSPPPGPGKVRAVIIR